MQQAGIEKRQWISARDANVRPTHAEADGQIRGIDEAFDVGSARLMQPGESGGPPEEVINCRCVAIAVAERAAAYLAPGFAFRPWQPAGQKREGEDTENPQ